MTLDDVHIFCPTSPAPWHPSIDITRKALESVFEMLGGRPTVSIWCDFPAPWVTRKDAAAYWDYVTTLTRARIGSVQVKAVWVGLVGLVREFITDNEHPVVINWQHDWECLQPELVDAAALVAEMCRPSSPVQYVRFHRRGLSIASAATYVKDSLVEAPLWEPIQAPHGLPLVPSNGWGDSPHFATRRHYHTLVRDHASSHTDASGRRGLESRLGQAYKHAIREDGFRAAHLRWGSWFYGSLGDGPYVAHLGRAATKWRKKRMPA